MRTLALFPLLALALQNQAAEPVYRVLNTSEGTLLLANGDFETSDAGKPSHWTPAPNGCSLLPGQGLNSASALAAQNSDAQSWSGASQSLQLNRSDIQPIRIRGWSRAINVSGSPDSGYSLYVDLVYQDGTPLWGQTADFPTGTHDWVRREMTIIPQKPVKTLTLHCILRGHSGSALFDNLSVEELRVGAGTTIFQGVAISPAPRRVEPEVRQTTARNADVSDSRRSKRTKTADGLELLWNRSSVQMLRPKPQPPHPPGNSQTPASFGGFLARDVATGSGFYAFSGDRCADLNLSLNTTVLERPGHVEIRGRISDLFAKDRAITLVFCLPISADGWSWGDDIHHSRKITGGADFANVTSVRSGAVGTMSLYPLAAVSGPEAGVAIGLDMAAPAVYRTGYHSGLSVLYIAYDFGLVPDTRNFPSAADFRFVIYRFDPAWGFRAAFDKFTRIFPDHFIVRSRDQGIWMPFTDISTVQDWQDFGFKYHEGNNNVPWDNAHGVLSFRYSEPMTWWMRMNKSVPRTFEQAVRARYDLSRDPNPHTRDMATVAQIAAMFDESGQPSLLFRNEPWCDGAVWSINPNPYVRRAPSPTSEPPAANPQALLNGGTIHWNPTLKDSLYGAKAKATLDGEYLDSLEGYVTADLNFRRDHFVDTTVPLTFSIEDHRPALFKGLAVFEFTKWISDDVHRLNRLMFANGVPYRFGFLCPWLDVLGTETDWLRNGRYQPVPDTLLGYWRTLSCRKPYVLLMNTDYDAFDFKMVESYFQLSMFYGFLPSMFSHNAAENPYWQNPKWYNRDRPLFKKYLPAIKTIAQAGWQPVTRTRSSNPAVLVERFGPDSSGTLYLTMLNTADSAQEATLTLEAAALGVPARPGSIDLLTQAAATLENIRLAPREAKAVAIKKN